MSREDAIIMLFEQFVVSGVSLPSTTDGKVNVLGLVRHLGLKVSDAQYFHRSERLKHAVNAVADEQGLKPIGWRASQTAADEAVQRRISSTSAQAKADAQASVEAKHAYEALLAEHKQLQERYTRLEAAYRVASDRLARVESVLPFERFMAEIAR